MNKLDTARLNTLVRQLNQGVIGQIEFLAAVQLPTTVMTQVDTLLTLPRAAHSRVKIEDLTWPHIVMPVSDDDFGLGNNSEDDEPKSKIKPKKTAKRKPALQRNLEFFKKLAGKLFGEDRDWDAAARDLMRSLELTVVGDDEEPSLTMRTSSHNVAQLITTKIMRRNTKLPAGQQSYTLTVEPESLLREGLSIPPLARLNSAARAYDMKLQEFIFGMFGVNIPPDNWKPVPVSFMGDGDDDEVFYFEFPDRDLAATFVKELLIGIDSKHHSDVGITRFDELHLYHVVHVPSHILFKHDLVPPSGVAVPR